MYHDTYVLISYIGSCRGDPYLLYDWTHWISPAILQIGQPSYPIFSLQIYGTETLHQQSR